jgi:AraC-like DNA-binding protein
MIAGTAPPMARVRFRTRDPDEAWEFTRAAYADHVPHLSGELSDFSFEVCQVREPRFGVEHLRHSLGQDCVAAPLGWISVLSIRTGRIGLSDRRAHGTASPGEVMLVPPDGAHRIWRSGISVGIVRLHPDSVAEVAREYFDQADGRVRFRLCQPLTAAHAAHWSATAEHVLRGVLANPAVADAPLVRTQALHLLTTALLSDFCHSGLDRDEQVSVGPVAAPAVVRRAMAFIETHASDDVTVGDIAAAARVRPRALQLAFRRHLERTPTAVLRDTRLAGARSDLQRADPTAGDTVAAIAHRWGFAGLAAFGSAYRRQYGETPRDTLRA